MALSDLSPSTQNYLKIIWSIAEHTGTDVTTSLIASQSGLKQSTVSDALKRLRAAGLITHQPYSAVVLTPQGRRYAVSMIRRHRLLETFLVEILGYTWDQVHDEAEVLEHAVSDTMIERIDALLGYPKRDPHGDPIPSLEGELEHPRMVPLTELEAGATAITVERVVDTDPHLLRLLAGWGIRPGASFTFNPGSGHQQSADPSGGVEQPQGAVTLTGESGQAITLTREQASALFVSITG